MGNSKKNEKFVVFFQFVFIHAVYFPALIKLLGTYTDLGSALNRSYIDRKIERTLEEEALCR